MILATPSGTVALSASSAAALFRIAAEQEAGRHPNAAAFHAVALEPLYVAGLVKAALAFEQTMEVMDPDGGLWRFNQDVTFVATIGMKDYTWRIDTIGPPESVRKEAGATLVLVDRKGRPRFALIALEAWVEACVACDHLRDVHGPEGCQHEEAGTRCPCTVGGGS